MKQLGSPPGIAEGGHDIFFLTSHLPGDTITFVFKDSRCASVSPAENTADNVTFALFSCGHESGVFY